MEKERLLAMFNKEKKIKLISCVIVDLLGNLSYFFPILGAFIDIPLASITSVFLAIMFWKYGKGIGIFSGGFHLAEEWFPFVDFVPSATIMWFVVFIKYESRSFKTYVEREEEKLLIVDKRSGR